MAVLYVAVLTRAAFHRQDPKLCPMLLLNGVVNIFYYLGEATLYKQPLGVLLLPPNPAAA